MIMACSTNLPCWLTGAADMPKVSMPVCASSRKAISPQTSTRGSTRMRVSRPTSCGQRRLQRIRPVEPDFSVQGHDSVARRGPVRAGGECDGPRCVEQDRDRRFDDSITMSACTLHTFRMQPYLGCLRFSKPIPRNPACACASRQFAVLARGIGPVSI